MTKEELKEAIAATITENGQKGITGQALANLLNEIVDAAGEGGGAAGEGGGGGTLFFAVEMELSTGSISSGPNEANAQVYQTLVEGLENATAYSVSVLASTDLSEYGAGIIRSVAYPTGYDFMDGGIMFAIGTANYIVYEDGSIVEDQESL